MQVQNSSELFDSRWRKGEIYLESLVTKKTIRYEIERLELDSPLDCNGFFERVKNMTRPNFTYLQLLLQERNVNQKCYHQLRLLMEEKFNLTRHPDFGPFAERVKKPE